MLVYLALQAKGNNSPFCNARQSQCLREVYRGGRFRLRAAKDLRWYAGFVVRMRRPECGIADSGRWLGRQGSNLGMAESKSAALPLGYAPSSAGRDHNRNFGQEQFLHQAAAFVRRTNEVGYSPTPLRASDCRCCCRRHCRCCGMIALEPPAWVVLRPGLS